MTESLIKRKHKDCEKGNSTISKTMNKKIKVIESVFNIKVKAPELDEELHDALFLDAKVDSIQENINTLKEVNPKKYKVNTIDTIIEHVVNNTSPENTSPGYKMCIYFNKDCSAGGKVVKTKINTLPNTIGPDLVSSVFQQAITILVNLNYFPLTALKKIKKIGNLLLTGLNNVRISIMPRYVFHFIITL